MVKVKKMKRIAVAVKNLDEAIKRYERLFGVKVFARDVVPEDRYEWAAFAIGEGDCTMEFLSPYNDPEGEVLIGKFIKNRGEGLYMVTLETEGTNDESEAGLRAGGAEPIRGRKEFRDLPTAPEGGVDCLTWTESYVHPQYTHGVLFVLASIVYK